MTRPASVPDEWRRIFEASRTLTDDGRRERRRRSAPAAAAPARSRRRRRPPELRSSDPAPDGSAPSPRPTPTLLGGVAAAMALVKAYRMHGHLAAHLDPLGSEPMGDPALDETRLVPSLTPELQARIPASLLRLSVPGETLLDALPRLREVYTGSIAYEIEHIADHAERVWLRKAIESGRFRARAARRSERTRAPASPLPGRGLRAVPPALVPRTEAVLARGARRADPDARRGDRRSPPRSGAHEVVIGMAHRGRLNALVHTVGRSYESVLREFEGERSYDALVVDPEGGSGDVKYHLPASGHARHRRTARSRSRSRRTRATSRPSHPSSRGGRAPSRPTARGAPALHDPTVALAVLIHGDAAFPGQGVVAETFNLQSLEGYATGRHAAPDHEQPGRLHDRSDRGPLDALLERPREGVRRPDRPRQRRRPGGGAERGPARARVPRRVRPRLRDRPRRLPALRAPGAGRGGVHAAAAGRADPVPADRARAVRRAARGGGRGRAPRRRRRSCAR